MVMLFYLVEMTFFVAKDSSKRSKTTVFLLTLVCGNASLWRENCDKGPPFVELIFMMVQIALHTNCRALDQVVVHLVRPYL